MNGTAIYSAGLMSQSFWLPEFKKAVKLRQDGLGYDEIKKKLNGYIQKIGNTLMHREFTGIYASKFVISMTWTEYYDGLREDTGILSCQTAKNNRNRILDKGGNANVNE